MQIDWAILMFRKKNVRNTGSILMLFSFVAMLSCSPTRLPSNFNGACTSNVDLPGNLEHCAGSVDIVYQYRNGEIRPHGNPIYAESLYLKEYYKPQEKENYCFAAALQMSLASQGLYRTQSDFVNAVGKGCFLSNKNSATYSQIVYAATRATSSKNEGVWVLPTPQVGVGNYANNIINNFFTYKACNNGICKSNEDDTSVLLKSKLCQTEYGGYSTSWVTLFSGVSKIPKFDLYRPVMWIKSGKKNSKRYGGIVPIRDMGDLVYQFKHGAPVVIGLSQGHVVLLTELWYYPGPSVYAELDLEVGDRSHINSRPDRSTRIMKLTILDPKSPETPIKGYDAENFFENVSFMFAVYGG